MSLADRARTLNATAAGSGPVVYVMAREQRVDDNWALLYAADQAKKQEVALVVMFALGPMFCSGTARHNQWMVASLQQVEKDLNRHQIPFVIKTGEWEKVIPSFVKEHSVGEVVFDFNPLQPVRGWRESVADKVTCRVTEVDARNIIPCWLASDKAEFAAHTFRPKVHKKLGEYLESYPDLHKPPVDFTGEVPAIDWEAVAAYRSFAVDAPVPDTFTPGSRAAEKVLEEFIQDCLDGYSEKRNDPNEAGLSNLSPYLRWGNISVATVALKIKSSDTPREDRDAFLEELIVRRELTDNYVFYTPEYNQVAGAHAWAQKTLAEHAKDKREYLYTLEQFEETKTHDELWNAMQTQMVREGKMHGWCRMYWAKKILEWTPDPQTAIDIALTLNDRYELDGRDSNGVVGVMWSVAGVHDRAWGERPVFGKIRYMNFNGAKRKFKVDEYISRYSGNEEQSLFND